MSETLHATSLADLRRDAWRVVAMRNRRPESPRDQLEWVYSISDVRAFQQAVADGRYIAAQRHLPDAIELLARLAVVQPNARRRHK